MIRGKQMTICWHVDDLGMHLDYSEEGKCKITMSPYTQDIIDSFPEEIVGISTTPAADHLFKVRDEGDAKKLPEEQAVAFHRTTAQLLFLSGRARRDIQTAVAFLATRVKAPKCEGHWNRSMVRGCILRDARGLQGPYWGHDDSGRWRGDQHLSETTNKCKKLDRGGANRGV